MQNRSPKIIGLSFYIILPMKVAIKLVGGLEHLLFFHSVGNVIIPTDELIFFRGVGIPPTRKSLYNHIIVIYHLVIYHSHGKSPFYHILPMKVAIKRCFTATPF
jgi:hypothetical protein